MSASTSASAQSMEMSARSAPSAPSVELRIANRPMLTVLLLVGSDLAAMLLAAAVGVMLKHWLGGDIARWDIYRQLWPLIFLFPVVYAAMGMYSGLALYPSVSLGPADELRRATFSSTLVFLALAASTFLFRWQVDAADGLGARRYDAALFSRSIFLIAWIAALISVPVGRTMVRGLFAKKAWWGHPVVVLGAGVTGRLVVKALQSQPELGLKAVALLDDDSTRRESADGAPVLGGLELSPMLAKKYGISYAIVAMPGVDEQRLRELYTKYGDVFAHLLIIPSLVGFSSLWVCARDVGGIMGLEVRQRLLLAGPRRCKRMLDLLITLVGGLVLAPFLMLVAVMIKLESRGPIFFKQSRPGMGGKMFDIYKFRTMQVDAEQGLAQLPEALRGEYEQYGKIRRDPRLTRVGRWLRRLSIDEFPQLWNVLRGEMSLVGPRAYLKDQVDQIAEHQALIEKVPPGITGIWQTSGRSKVSMPKRLEMDAYYVRNWSVWLDLYILMRTFWVVVVGKGAY